MPSGNQPRQLQPLLKKLHYLMAIHNLQRPFLRAVTQRLMFAFILGRYDLYFVVLLALYKYMLIWVLQKLLFLNIAGCSRKRSCWKLGGYG